jgi:multiple sugar transport system permease protein
MLTDQTPVMRTPLRAGSPRRSTSLRRHAPAVPAFVVLALFLVFFALPLLWLLLAATKTDDQLVHDSPLSFGSWTALKANWDALSSFQDNAIFRWLGNSLTYSRWCSRWGWPSPPGTGSR